MTIANIAQARDEISAMVRTALKAAPLSFTDNQLQWDDLGPPPTFQNWVRVTIKHAEGEKVSLTNPLTTKSRYNATGTVFVQVFTVPGDGLAKSDQITKVLQDCFEGKYSPGGIWFRRVRVNEIGNNGGLYQVNVLADFSYDVIK